jgi:hypothetical protein
MYSKSHGSAEVHLTIFRGPFTLPSKGRAYIQREEASLPFPGGDAFVRRDTMIPPLFFAQRIRDFSDQI